MPTAMRLDKKDLLFCLSALEQEIQTLRNLIEKGDKWHLVSLRSIEDRLRVLHHFAFELKIELTSPDPSSRERPLDPVSNSSDALLVPQFAV